ncbi:MAG: hypothetical protein AAF697_02420 [Pseudomonadota bacterium]
MKMFNGKSKIASTALAFGVLAMAASAIPAQAQFRNLLRDSARGAQSAEAAEGCEDEDGPNVARGVLGGILGGAGRRTANRVGLGSFVPVESFTDTLAKEIACKLNEEEQEQAANATITITTSTTDEEGNEVPPAVGRSAAWESDTREDVSGTSTITSREASSGSNDCITVTDVIIVEGEETRAEKRMCRLAGSPRYTIVA